MKTQHRPERSLIEDVNRIYKAEVERRWAIALLSIAFGLTIGISFMYGMCGG